MTSCSPFEQNYEERIVEDLDYNNRGGECQESRLGKGGRKRVRDSGKRRNTCRSEITQGQEGEHIANCQFRVPIVQGFKSAIGNWESAMCSLPDLELLIKRLLHVFASPRH